MVGSIYELAVVVANTILWASIVASIEQTIHQNHQQEALGDWTFGQTLAICAAIYGAIQAMSDWKSHWPDIKKSKNKGQLISGLIYTSHYINTKN